jgi:sigma-B regulation protein RsbU (phosphoserine phosphatase)
LTQNAAEEAPEERTLHVHLSALSAKGLVDDPIDHALVLHSPGQPPRRFPLEASPVSIGRVMPNTILLEDSAVSRRHCQVVLVGDHAEVTDLGSLNGTFVDGVRVTAKVTLEDGARLRIGPHELRYERKRRSEIDREQSVDRELAKAQSYVNALLPPPIKDGPVQACWCFQPCDTLGGDAFGYQMIGPDWFIAYILDVSGHGAGSAMLSVSVMNVLRQRLLPGIDMREPAAVLAGLNDMFDMDSHHGLYFTMWYGAYHLPTRRLIHSAAGHHPAMLRAPGSRDMVPVGTRNVAVGMRAGHGFDTDTIRIAPDSRLYLFSDGAYEIAPADGPAWGLRDMLAMLRAPPVPGLSEPDRIYRTVRAASPTGQLDDDFSVLELHFL